jgi:voltage-gated potassium channel
MGARRRFAVALVIISLVLLIGTIGLVLLEGWPPFDALYMVVTTVATVGYGEIRPLSMVGRTFIMVLIVVGAGTVLYALTALAEALIEGQVAPANVLSRRQRQRVRKMRDHVIVCGFGRVGAQVAAELAREGVPVVIVDSDAEALARAAAAGYAGLTGDASSDAALTEAGIARARGLVATTNSDANNVYVTLAARALRPDLFIVARVDRDEAASRLRTAGADRVISPYHLGGRRMASLVLRPAVVDFVDTILQSQDGPLRMEEVLVREQAPLAGMAVGDMRLRLEIDVTVLALVKPGGGVLANPPPPTVISAGDVLVVLGRLDMLDLLEQNCGTAATRRH